VDSAMKADTAFNYRIFPLCCMEHDDQVDYTTAPCKWTDRDADIVADYLILKELGLKNSPTLNG